MPPVIAPDLLPPFIGRADELTSVPALLDRARVVTLVGAPGIGKSRLAREVLGRHAGAVIDCDLHGARDADTLSVAVASALGATSLESGLDALAKASVPTWILLDAIDGASRAVGAMCATLVAASPLVTLLLTSRQPLGLPAEHVMRIAPLNAADARKLLVDRSLAAGTPPDMLADLSELDAVAAAVDRIPLALVMVAPRLAWMTPSQLVERLFVDSSANPLGAALAASWQTLTDNEQDTIERCSVLPHGFTLETADGIAGRDVTQAAAGLVDKSLLYAQGADRSLRRLAMYAPVRHFAAARLVERGLHAETARRARRILLEHVRNALSEHLVQPHPQLHTLLRCELDNLCELVDGPGVDPEPGARFVVAEAAAVVARGRGPYEVVDRLDASLGAADGWPTPLLLARGQLERARGQLRLAAELLAIVHQRAEGSLHAALATLELGIVDHQRGDAEQAADRYQEALVALEALDHRAGEAQARGSLAILAEEHGNFDDAEVGYERTLAIFRVLGDLRGQAIFLSNLGDLHKTLGRVDVARRHYERACAMAERAGDERVRGVAIGNLGTVYQELTRFDDARECLLTAGTALSGVGDARLSAVFGGYLAALDHEVGAYDAARRGYVSAIERLRYLGDRRYSGLFACHLEGLQAATGRARARRGDAVAEHAPAELDARARALASIYAELESGVDLSVATADQAHRDDAEQRFARRVTDTFLAKRSPAPGVRVLHVGADGATFRLGANPVVDLVRRRNLRRILTGLADLHGRQPGGGLGIEEIFAIGWPGETVGYPSLKNRVYVAITTLRKLGLSGVLIHDDGGYLLDPTVLVVR